MLGQSARRTSYHRFGSFRGGVACGLVVMGGAAWGASAATNPIPVSAATNAESMIAMPAAEPSIYRNNIIDTVQGSASTRIVLLARWVDSFFDDPEYAVEEADARASFQQSVTFYRNLDAEFNSRVRATVLLPNLERRFRLSFEGNDEETADEEAGAVDETLADSTRQSIDDPSLRLQYFFLHRPEIDISMSGGVRLSETSFYVGPRFKLRAGIGGGWDARFIQRIYWYTTNDLKSKSELRFDHLLGQYALFRQAFWTDWDEEKHETEGFRNSVTSSVTQPINRTAAFRYAWSSAHQTRPDPRWVSTTLSVSYRQSIWRDWIIVELSPFVTWEEEFNWDPKPGATVSLSAIFEE